MKGVGEEVKGVKEGKVAAWERIITMRPFGLSCQVRRKNKEEIYGHGGKLEVI